MSAIEFISRTVRCPACDTQFTADQPVVPPIVGRDSDLRPVFDGRDPLPTLVLTCPTCRYSAFAEGYLESELPEEEKLALQGELSERPAPRTDPPGDDEIPSLRRYLQSAEFREGLGEAEPAGAARYILAARIYEFLREDALVAGADLYLRGSWAARSLGQRELERRCQREAARRIEAALTKGSVKDADKPRSVYLAAELHRRAGEFTQAVDGFEKLKGLLDEDDEEQGQLAELGRKLYALATVKSSVNAELPRPPREEE